MSNPSKAPLYLTDILSTVLAESAFFADEQCLFTAHLEKRHPRVCFVAGDNASGKSLLVQFVKGWLGNLRKGAQYVRVSMEERTGSGTHEMGSFRRSIMFGNEAEQSTGETSVSTVQKALGNLAQRLADGDDLLLILDEPEIGLSTSYHHALGLLIGSALKDQVDNPRCVGLMLVSHSKELYQGLAQGLGSAPTFVHMGEDKDSQQWLQSTARRSLEELQNLQLVARTRHKAVLQYLHSKD